MKATIANLKRCGAMTVMFCTKCNYNYQYSVTDRDDWDFPDGFVFKCLQCESEMILGHFVNVFIPEGPRVIAVIHDQEDYISTWLVEAEPDADPLEAIHKELFEGDEDWDDYLKDDIEWFYLKPLAAMTLKDIEWPDTEDAVQHFEQHRALEAIYRAFRE